MRACPQYKLCRVSKSATGPKGVPYIVTHDGRTIRYPQPGINVNDTVKVDIESGKVTEALTFETGQLVMVTGGHNVGRVGVLVRQRPPLARTGRGGKARRAAGRPSTTVW